MRETLFDPDHFDRVMLFERDVTQYVKKQFRTLYENCIMIGSWDGFLGRGIAAKHITKWLEPLKHWVGREKELPTNRNLEKWYGWLNSYESVKTYIENHPELEPEAVRIIKSQCLVYDEIPSYPYGRFSVPTPVPETRQAPRVALHVEALAKGQLLSCDLWVYFYWRGRAWRKLAQDRAHCQERD